MRDFGEEVRQLVAQEEAALTLTEPVFRAGGLRLDRILLVVANQEAGNPVCLVLAMAVPQMGIESAGVTPGETGIIGEAGREAGITGDEVRHGHIDRHAVQVVEVRAVDGAAHLKGELARVDS